MDWSLALKGLYLLMLMIVGVSILLLVTALASYLSDRIIYNNGTCRSTGKPWTVTQLSDGRVLLESCGQRRMIGKWIVGPEFCR